jgi:N-acetylated-alpha-linked acidic dipeptidase
MLTTLEHSVLNELTTKHAWELLEKFSHLKREHPRDVDTAVEMVRARLSALGVPARTQVMNLYLSLPGAARVEAGGKSWRAKPSAMCVSAPDGVQGKLVYVPAKGDFLALLLSRRSDLDPQVVQQIQGNIVLTEGIAGPGITASFESLGARGVIAINPGEEIHSGICSTMWGNPDIRTLDSKPRIVVLAVNKPDGEVLIEVAKQGGTVKLFAELEEGWFPSSYVSVDIPGSEQPEKFVLLHGHIDSWDVGVGDNGTGAVTLLEVARALWTHRDKLKRSVRVVWWPGHSTGRYAGSAWYADRFALELDERCVAQINCDSPGCRWATDYIDLACMSEAGELLTGVIADAAAKPVELMRPMRAGDYSFNNIGLSGLLMLSSTMSRQLQAQKSYYRVGGNGGNIEWHTEKDLLEIADEQVMATDLKVYTLATLRVASAEYLPFDWRATVREFQQTIEQYQQNAGDRFDFTPSTQASESLLDALERFYAAIALGGVTPARANEVLQGLARLLVPINYTLEPRFEHDPALNVPPLPTIALAKDLQRYQGAQIGFAATQLTRGQNRLVSTLRAAWSLLQQ